MKAMLGTRWVGSEHNAIIGQIDISSDEIAVLGGNIERSNSALGPVEAAVFALEAGKVILLYRTKRNPVRAVGNGHRRVASIIMSSGIRRADG